MTEIEALEELKTFPINCLDFKENQALQVAIKALEEIQKYRELGSIEEILKVFNNQRTIIATQHETLKQYKAIGTIEEFKALKEKQEKGLLLELPCKIGDWVWTWEYPTRIDEEDGSTWTICDIKRATIVSKRFNIFMFDRVGESYFASKEEAEKALAKRQGK